jgi:hypothetical protein
MPETLAERLARRIELRDNPPPPPPLSQQPVDVHRRIASWLRATHGHRDRRTSAVQAHFLLHLLEHSSLTTQQLLKLLGQGERATARMAATLGEYGLVTHKAYAGKRYHRLTPAAEDALLLVIAGPKPPAVQG